MKYKGFQQTSDSESEKAERTMPNYDDLPHLHLINYLDRNEDCHIFKYMLDNKLDVSDNTKDFSMLKRKKIAKTLEDGLKQVLDEAENLTEQSLNDFFLYDEEAGDCKLLDAAATDQSVNKEWYLILLFHQCTDSFLHYICGQNSDPIPYPTNSRLINFVQYFMKYLLCLCYPIIYTYIILIFILELICTPFKFCKNVKKSFKTHRENFENIFDEPETLCFIHWSSILVFFMFLVLYIISYFGAGLNHNEDCFCEPSHSWPTDWFSKMSTENWTPWHDQTADHETDYACNSDLLNTFFWLSCRSSADEYLEFKYNHHFCYNNSIETEFISHRMHAGSSYPPKLLTNEYWTHEEWEHNRNSDIMVDIGEFVENFKNSHYGKCSYYDRARQIHQFAEESYYPLQSRSNTFEEIFYQDHPENRTAEEIEMVTIFYSYYDMFKSHQQQDPLIWNKKAEHTLITMLLIFIIIKAIDEVSQFASVNFNWGKYCIDKINTIDVVHVASVFGYCVCEYYRQHTEIGIYRVL